MSEIERTVLVPLLARLQERLAGLTRTVPSRTWIPVLHAADEDVAHAERTLVRH
jgi:ribonuclease D